MLARNDIRQYDDLADSWWNLRGPFATLHWIAVARAQLVPQATSKSAVLVDLACGAGLLAPHVSQKGYSHIGVDLTTSALEQAERHGVFAINADVLSVPLPDACADVVCAGEIFEHIEDVETAVAESCRVLKPGGLVVIDTVANTAIARLVVVTLAERIPGGAPPGIHDPRLFVDRRCLVDAFAKHGVRLQLRGLRPSVISWIRWRAGQREMGQMVPTRSTSVLFQGWGRKRDDAGEGMVQ